MIRKTLKRALSTIRPKALILMYHRIAEPASDVWDIAVSPQHFEEQLLVLQKTGKVIPLATLAADLKNNKLQRNSIAITFDDGYADNFLTAKPLLEKYNLPATFFITTGNIGQDAEFWWDELEQLILFSPKLPSSLTISIEEDNFSFDLGQEAELNKELQQTHKNWKGLEQDPPSLRANLYLKLWQRLQPLPHLQQQQLLALLRDWAGSVFAPRKSYACITVAQLKELAQRPLFTLGIHTVTHPALAYHTEDFQEQEIRESRAFIEKSTGNSINLLAYPYGNHSNTTVEIAKNQQLLAAVTTEERPVRSNTNLFQLGRFQVKNWNAAIFEQHLKQWKKRN